MFKKKENKEIDLLPLLEESKSQLLAAQQGQFNTKIVHTAQNELLQQIIDNFNEVNVLREKYVCSVAAIISFALSTQKVQEAHT